MKETSAVPVDVNAAWQETLRIVESTVGTPVFEACLRDAQPVEYDHGTLRIAVPGQFQRDWLANRSKDSISGHLEQALQMLTGQDYKLEFVVPGATPPVAAVAPIQIIESPRTASASDDGKHDDNAFRLSDKYTFESFVVGSSNQLAYAAAMSVAENPGKSCNPLFIYGGVGLGKTHLMMAAGQALLRHKKKAQIVYVSSETFTNELIESIQNQQMQKFRKKYRHVDLLLVDDVQFLMSKERTQEEFFYTFNELYSNHKQIVISSDRPPHELHPLPDRLRSRFASGLIADIQPPDLETREAILRKKAEMERITVPNEIISFIAERFPSNIRELEGAMVRVVFWASLNKRPITMESALEALKEMLPDVQPRTPSIKLIQEKVCYHFRIKLDDLTSQRRDQKFALPRQLAMYLCREMTGATYADIANEFGGKHHSTVMHACDKIEGIIDDPSIRSNLDGVRKLLQG